MAQKQESTKAQQRKMQQLQEFDNPQYCKITWSKFPEVIEVSIQMSVVPSKYIQVSVVGNCTQKDEHLKELITDCQNEQTNQSFASVVEGRGQVRGAHTDHMDDISSWNSRDLPVSAAMCMETLL